jgi:histidinol dehydrogenase
MELAIANVSRFADVQKSCLKPVELENLPGVHLCHRVVPIERVGVYVPEWMEQKVSHRSRRMPCDRPETRGCGAIRRRPNTG